MASWLQFAALLAAACAVSGQTTENPSNCHVACSCNGDIMRCVDAQLTAPPEGYWSSYSLYLALDGNNITKLYYYSFAGFPYLTRLTLSNNHLATLDPEPFRYLSNLRSLDLSGNHISHIDTYPYVKRITELYLNNNKLTELDPPSILSSWVVTNGLVDLKNNPLKASPGKAFIGTDYMGTLLLDGMDASELSSDSFVGSASYLTTLSLQNAGVQDITGVFTRLTRLKTVWLSGNNITHVTAGSFYTGRDLGALHLNDNPLQRLDVAAVDEAIPYSSSSANKLDISDTPLACECGYEDLYWWAKGRGVELTANCQGDNACQFAR